MIGTSLNQYRITATVGAGGMGEVFRARDTRLNRDVAVKVLPKAFAADADRLRLEQSALSLAALHPRASKTQGASPSDSDDGALVDRVMEDLVSAQPNHFSHSLPDSPKRRMLEKLNQQFRNLSLPFGRDRHTNHVQNDHARCKAYWPARA